MSNANQSIAYMQYLLSFHVRGLMKCIFRTPRIMNKGCPIITKMLLLNEFGFRLFLAAFLDHEVRTENSNI